jgi:hypothetical protein
VDPARLAHFEGPEARQRALDEVRGQARSLAFDKRGCCLVQRALYAARDADTATKDALLTELLVHDPERKIVLKMIESPHANHVALRMLEVLLEDARGPGAIVKQLEGKAKHVATHRYGCRLLVKLLSDRAARQKCAGLVNELRGQESFLRDHRMGKHVVEAMREHEA